MCAQVRPLFGGYYIYLDFFIVYILLLKYILLDTCDKSGENSLKACHAPSVGFCYPSFLAEPRNGQSAPARSCFEVLSDCRDGGEGREISSQSTEVHHWTLGANMSGLYHKAFKSMSSPFALKK